LFIYVLNVLRIAALCTDFFIFQNKSRFTRVLFSLYIYGVVFMLWLIWVRTFLDMPQKIPITNSIATPLFGGIVMLVQALKNELFYDPL
jgi:hypothetical protein